MRLNKWDKKSIVTAIMSDVPKPDKNKRRTELQDNVVKLMSTDCRKVFKNSPKALATYRVGEVICDYGYYSDDNVIVCGDVTGKQIEELIKKYKQEDNAIQEARNKLNGIIGSCSSLKQLTDRLPEFKSYFPTEEKPTANLPALANVVADLSKLGWPKKESK